MVNDMRIIGHRGAAAYAPENTIVSFQKALDLGCKFIEFDVMQSLDGDLFIFHDKFLARTSNGHGMFAQKKSAYIKTLDAGKWFAQKYSGVGIPTLQDTILWLNKKDVYANIEIKPSSGQVFAIAHASIDTIKRYWAKDKELPLVSSFNYQVLQVCRKLDAQVPLGFLINDWPRNWLDLMDKINCKTINVNHSAVDKRSVQFAIEHGITVNVFTVNRALQAKKFFKFGVSSVFSDYPDLLTNVNLLHI